MVDEKSTKKHLDKSNKTWVKDGIIYVEVHDALNLENVLKMEKGAMQLISDNHKEHMPIILILDKSDDNKADLNIADFGKIVLGAGIIKHLSAISVVGAGKHVKKHLTIINKLFLSNRVGFFDNIEEAETVSRDALSVDISLLE